MFLFLFSEDVRGSFNKNTDILAKAHSSRHLTHTNVFKKLDALGGWSDISLAQLHDLWKTKSITSMKMTMLTWQHYVHKVCKNVINMSKNHRHYVHLCTGARITHLCFLAQWILGSQVPAFNKSQYVPDIFLNTFLSHHSKLVMTPLSEPTRGDSA